MPGEVFGEGGRGSSRLAWARKRARQAMILEINMSYVEGTSEVEVWECVVTGQLLRPDSKCTSIVREPCIYGIT